MGGGYVVPASDNFDQLMRDIADLRGRLRELEAPDGSQLFDSVRELKSLVDNLAAEVESVSASGATWQGPVSTSGSVVANGGVSSSGVYNNLLTVAYRVQYITATGPMGYVPSSRRYKQDEQPAPDMKAAALAMQVVTFRYIQAVEQLGDDADVEWGVIAEDLHDLGLAWLIDYDEEGLPAGVKKEQLIFAFIPVIQDHEARLNAAGL